uniref:NADH dehydrogenase subunit 4 n=1 Tax=Arion flagellus TaxID=236857 RepID=UPI0024103FB6|nr:NADH dehydrogenase subunit 4 [Arion flagellus]WES82241.1 NADH dehydrogenase subunit 4 [Arion flagellus]
MTSLISSFMLSMCYRYWETLIGGLVCSLLYACSLSMKSLYYQEWYNSSFTDLSLLLIVLAIFISLLSLLLSVNYKMYSYRNTIITLTLIMLLCFSTNNLFYFYIFFEVSLIPILYMIISWGYQPERLQAGTYLLLYTVCASLPLLLFIFYIMNSSFTMNYFMLNLLQISIDKWYLLLPLLLALMVKLPIYVGHLWLPKAHVEAPLAGSMILAALLLKLGGYGIVLVHSLFILQHLKMISVLIIWSLWGGLLSSWVCMSQVDMKSFVAYTSVAHMSLVLSALLMNNLWGILAAKITMIAHGFTSSLMFSMAAMSYKVSGSRTLMINKGMLTLYPIMGFIWFLSLILCMAAPPSLNLLGELSFVPSFAVYSYVCVFILGLLMFFSALYSMYLYSSLFHGVSGKLLTPTIELKSSELLGVLLHFFPLFLIFKMPLFNVF